MITNIYTMSPWPLARWSLSHQILHVWLTYSFDLHASIHERIGERFTLCAKEIKNGWGFCCRKKKEKDTLTWLIVSHTYYLGNTSYTSEIRRSTSHFLSPIFMHWINDLTFELTIDHISTYIITFYRALLYITHMLQEKLFIESSISQRTPNFDVFVK